MMRTNHVEEPSPRAVDPHAEVEKMYIAEYLKSKGYSLAGLADLPEAAAKALLEQASLYASLRLAALETGAALVDKLHVDETMTTTSQVVQTSTVRP